MDRAIEQREALDLAPRRRRLELDRALDQVERGEHEKHGNQGPAAENRDVAVAQRAPSLALRLDQDVGLAADDGRRLRAVTSNLAPDRRVIQRLVDLTLRLRRGRRVLGRWRGRR